MLAWKDADVLDEINKIYIAKYNSDLEEDLLEASDSKHHPVIQVCMSENRDDEEGWDMVEKSVKVLASQAGLKVAEYSLLLALNKLREKVTNLEEVGILSPYKMHGQGITHQTAMWFITNCPKLR